MWMNSIKKLRQDVKDLVVEYNRTEDDLKAIQSVGQLIGDVLKQIDDEKWKLEKIKKRNWEEMEKM